MIRRIITTALVVGVPRAALACPVCFGQTDSPLASATNMGIIAMLVPEFRRYHAGEPDEPVRSKREAA